ncbi:uncharacterized protein TA07175 [Theileria annulata]|uniref:Uncharacterized protein n=1 Tax=Theileria annulata TaxID=5874 RepID=Q4UAA7_THEAN|nr:uncharacterized protein TA07175 [Theileria annulata]CAI76246.1 hypothetical protein, conserved [Theileria annulata]|eukprot:XP_952870.1 hypothetical protein, conserved [Theileria annulata]
MSISLTLLGSLNEHRGCINSIKFDSTGVYCMTAGNDRTVRLWNPSKKLHIKKFFGPHNYEVNDVCLREDNKNFVSVGAEHSAFLWDTLEAKIIRKYNHGGKICCCNYVWRNDLLVTGSEDKMVKVWDNRSKNPVQTFPDAKDTISCVNERNSTISASSMDGHVRHYDLRKGVLKDDAFTHSVISYVSYSLIPLRFSMLTGVPDCYIFASLDDTIKLVDNGTVLASYKGQTYDNYKVNCVFDPFEKFIISGCSSGDILFWPINSTSESCEVLVESAHQGVITTLSFSNPELLNSTGKLKKDVEKNVRELVLKEDNLLVSGGRDGHLKIWNLSYKYLYFTIVHVNIENQMFINCDDIIC